MSDMKIQPVVKNPLRNTLDTDAMKYWRGTRDGVAFTADYFESLAMQGRIFTANFGSIVTALTFLTYALNRPDAWVRVPAGTTILPLKVNVSLDGVTGTKTYIDLRMCQNDIGNGTSTAATALLPNRSDAPVASLCTARHLATGDTTAETNPLSLFRRTYARAEEAGIDARGLEIDRRLMGHPILVGPATLELFISATTNQATGFVSISWAEIPTTDLS